MIYNRYGDYMRRVFIPVVFLICLSIVAFVIFTKANNENITSDISLKIGEEKYLQFLWMVDGAYNSERLKEDFIVNNKSLSNEEKVFTCKYNSFKDKECIGNNFESEFKKLFSKNITYEKVYSDGVLYSWVLIKNGKYVFNNVNTCNINRMGINHTLKLSTFNNHKMVYQVEFLNTLTNQLIKRDFILVLEDNEWKISNAFYYDLCGMRNTIY